MTDLATFSNNNYATPFSQWFVSKYPECLSGAMGMSTLTGGIGGALTRRNVTSGGRTTTVTRSTPAMQPAMPDQRPVHQAVELSTDRSRIWIGTMSVGLQLLMGVGISTTL